MLPGGDAPPERRSEQGGRSPHGVWARYRRFLESPPHLVLEWSDPATGARGWLVVNSLRGGAAGGGTRMRRGLGREEVVYLSKAMALKFAFSGPPIGGAKSGIDFDPRDPRKEEVLQGWFAAIRPFLSTCYGTAGDVSVDEQREVAPLCAALGLRHPQEGVVRGHLGAEGEALERALAAISTGVHTRVEDPALAVPGRSLTVADLVTGYGVARAARRCLGRRGDALEGKRVLVEGFGNVGASCALYLARWGARVVGLVDAEHALVSSQGLRGHEVEALLARREDKLIPSHPRRRGGRARAAAYEVAAELFVPAAISGSVDQVRLEQLRRNGVQTIVCGANQPFREARLGDTRTQEAADAQFEVIADAVGSMGMARAFHHFMEGGDPADAPAVFAAVGGAVDRAVEAVVDRAGGRRRGLLAAAVDLALEKAGA